MKTNILTATIIALSLTAGAQCTGKTSCGASSLVYSDDKMTSMYRSLDNSTYSKINPVWEAAYNEKLEANETTLTKTKDCYRMVADRMFVVKNGASTRLAKYTTIQNGSLLLINGAVISTSGKISHLKNGDSINMEGLVTYTQTSSKETTLATL